MAQLREIAAQAGVSICTASKIINRAPGWQAYSTACIARVRQVAAQMGYRRNYFATALQTGRSDAIGMVVPQLDVRDMHNGFTAAMICGVEIGARDAGCHFVMTGPNAAGDVPRRATARAGTHPQAHCRCRRLCAHLAASRHT